MSEKQFKIEFDGHRYFLVIDEVNERCLARLDTMADARAWLEVYEMLSDENEQLKKENAKLQFELKECSDNKLFSRRELEKETERIKHIIKEAYETERTAIGKNVLKQLLDGIGVIE